MLDPVVNLPDMEAIGATPPFDLGHYRVEEEVSRGTMGVVYRALDTNLGRQVAIKTLPSVVYTYPARLARFLREVKILAAINHPNVSTIYGLEQYEGRLFAILEYVDGMSLHNRLENGRLPACETEDICAQIASGIVAAHESGVIHRDLKPANIMIRPNGQVKVLDFGLGKFSASQTSSVTPDSSKSVSASTELLHHTLPGVIMGTASYMSPEQARGQLVDRRTDVWSFGVILFECLTGTSCFKGDSAADSISAVLTKPIDFAELPNETSPVIRHILMRCLERDPKLRLRDLRDVQLSLNHDSSATRFLSPVPSESSGFKLAVTTTIAALALIVVTIGISTGVLTGSLSTTTSTHAVATYVELPATYPRHLWGVRTVVSTAQMPDRPSNVIWGDGNIETAISPDGQTLAYVGIEPDDEGEIPTSGIYIRSPGSLETWRMPGTEDAARISFSPDGSQLAFIWWDRTAPRQEIRLVNIVNGLVETVLADDSYDAFYSYGGLHWVSNSELLVVSNSSNELHRISIATGTVTSSIRYDVDHMGIAYEPVTIPGTSTVLLTRLQFTPDGTRKVLIGVDLETGERTHILDHAEYGVVTPSRHLVFIRDTNLCRVAFDLETLVVTGPPEVLISNLARGPFGISNDGSLLFVLDSPGDEMPNRLNLALNWLDHHKAQIPSN